MPYPNEHAARILSPGGFSEFRRKQIAPGLSLILGKLKGSIRWVTQAYRFNKKNYTSEKARKWLKDHNISYKSFEAASKS